MSSAKSQPLHNFTLPPLLRWKKDGKSSDSHKRRRLMKSPSQQRPDAASASPPHYSPLRDYLSPPSPQSSVIGGDSVEDVTVCERMKHLDVGGDSEKLSFLREEALRFSRGGNWSSEVLRKSKGAVIDDSRNQFKKFEFGGPNSEEGEIERKCKAKDGDKSEVKKKSNSPIKIASKNSKGEEEKTDEDGRIDEEKQRKTANNSDEDIKLWNLRPRNMRSKLEKAKVDGEKVDVSGKIKGLPQLRSCGKEGKTEKQNSEKREKKKLSINIALTKEEIEEDIFALTGSKPSRRPKRRPKNVQKQLDLAFPGLWLVSITPESYRVSESSLKG